MNLFPDGVVLVPIRMNLLLKLAQVNIRDCISSVEYATNLFEGWAFGLDIEEIHKHKLSKVPHLQS